MIWLILPVFLAAFVANDVFTQLQVTQADAKKRIFDALVRGYVSFPASSKNIPLVERALIVSQMAVQAKQYLGSTEFKAEYASWLKQEKDNLPLKDLEEAGAEFDKQQADMNALSTPKMLQDQIKSLTDVMNMMTDAATKKQFQDQIDDLKKQLAETKQPGYVDPMKQSAKEMGQFYTREMAIDNARQENEQLIQQYNATHIQDPNVLLKKRLQEFVSLSNSVDFNAATTTNKYGKLVFVSPAFESKSSAWKQCFRAGQAANEQARTFATQWLGELK